MVGNVSRQIIIGGLVVALVLTIAGITWFTLYGPGVWTGNISNRDLTDTTADAGLPRVANG